MEEHKKKLTKAIQTAYPKCTVEVTFKQKGSTVECNWPLKAAKELKISPTALMLQIITFMEPGDKILGVPEGLIYIRS